MQRIEHLYQHRGQPRAMENMDDSEVVGGLRPGETLVRQMGRFLVLSRTVVLQAAQRSKNTYCSTHTERQTGPYGFCFMEEN